jgi:hypothetical protein
MQDKKGKKKKADIKVRDLKPRKDAKGGSSGSPGFPKHHGKT